VTVTSYWAGGQIGFDGIDTGLSTPLGFPMFGAMRDVIAHGVSAQKLVDVLRQDRLYPHPELLVTFLDNHDRTRFLTEAGGSVAKLKLGFSLLAATRGIPQLYYGDEVGMEGAADPDNRRDFPGGFPGDSHNAFTREGRTPSEQDVYSHLQTLLKLRHDHPALRTGVQKHVSVREKYYAFTREGSGERLLVVFFNDTAAGDLTIELSGTSIENAKSLAPIFGDCKAELAGSQLHLHPSPLSLTIFQVQLPICLSISNPKLRFRIQPRFPARASQL
jgi:glycosidase